MSSTIPIADPEQLEVCPYEPSHRVQSRRMVYHLEKCRKAFVGQKKICPFNGKHRVPAPELSFHINTCPDKAMIDQDLRYSGMKQTGFIDESPCGDLNVPDDEFNIISEENWEAETDENQSCFRLGRKRIECSSVPNDKDVDEQLRRPSSNLMTTQAPVYNFSALNLNCTNLGRGRGRGRGYTPQENGISKEEIYFSTPEDKVPIGRGFGLSKMTGAQQWQKSNFTILSVNAENQFSLGVGRGLKKKENIENNSTNKTVIALPLEDLQKQSRRLEKKLRQIAKLKEKEEQGIMLDKDEEKKLAKKEIVEMELEYVTSKIKSCHIK